LDKAQGTSVCTHGCVPPSVLLSDSGLWLVKRCLEQTRAIVCVNVPPDLLHAASSIFDLSRFVHHHHRNNNTTDQQHSSATTQQLNSATAHRNENAMEQTGQQSKHRRAVTSNKIKSKRRPHSQPTDRGLSHSRQSSAISGAVTTCPGTYRHARPHSHNPSLPHYHVQCDVVGSPLRDAESCSNEYRLIRGTG